MVTLYAPWYWEHIFDDQSTHLYITRLVSFFSFDLILFSILSLTGFILIRKIVRLSNFQFYYLFQKGQNDSLSNKLNGIFHVINVNLNRISSSFQRLFLLFLWCFLSTSFFKFIPEHVRHMGPCIKSENSPISFCTL